MKITYRFANIEDIDELVRLRMLMQFEVNHSGDKNISDEFTQKVKAYFSKARTLSYAPTSCPDWRG